MSQENVDVLIIGAGASGAAMAWSLAETRMQIVCLEQGGLMNPLAYPSTGRDWEARALSDMATNPNVRGLPGDYPINETVKGIIKNYNKEDNKHIVDKSFQVIKDRERYL